MVESGRAGDISLEAGRRIATTAIRVAGVGSDVMNLRQALPTLDRAPIAAAETDGGEGIARYVRSGALGAAGGAVSLLRAASAYRRGDRKRAAIRALIAGLWIGGAVVQRRRSRGATGASESVDQRDVVDTSVGDLEAAAGDGPEDDRTEPGAGADVDRSDVAGTGVDIEDAADDEGEGRRSAGSSTGSDDDTDVDESDVVDTGPDYEGATDDGDGGTDEGDADRDRSTDGESASDEGAATEGDGDEGEDESGNPYDPADFE